MGLQSLFADCYIFHCTQTLQARRQLHHEEELARALVRMLWLQERVTAKHSRVVKVATESNPAAMLTKALGRSTMDELCEEIGQTEAHAKTVDKEPKEAKKPKNSQVCSRHAR